MGDDAGEDTKLCSNCKRHISTANFVMHEMHCHRNITVCRHCQEPIPKAELESHYDEMHTKTPCTKCGVEVEKSHMEKHEEEECSRRQVKCTFCEMDVAYIEFKSHQGYCGTRTESCVKCNQFIMVKDMLKHEESNCTFPEQKPTNENQPGRNLRGDSRTAAIGLDDGDDLLFGGGELNSFAFEEVKRILNASEDPGRRSGVNVRARRNNNESTTQGRKPPQMSTSSKSSRMKSNQKSDLNRLRERASRRGQSPTSGEEQDRLLALELEQDFRDSTDIDRLIQNIDKPGSYDIADDYPQIDGLDTEFGEMTMLPCEFCGEVLPGSQLVQHQSFCSEDPFSSIVPHPITTNNASDSLVNNNVPQISHTASASSTPHVIDNLHNRAPAVWSTEPLEEPLDDDVFLPCEFCDDLFPQDMLVQHQAVCDRSTAMTPRVMSPVMTRDARKPPKPKDPRLHPHNVDINTILSRNDGAEKIRGTHSYELDSTLRKYGTKPFDQYKSRRSRQVSIDDNRNISSSPIVSKRVNPRTKSAAKTKETLDRLLDDRVAVPSPDVLLDNRQGRKDLPRSSRQNSMPSSTVPKTLNGARGTTRSIKTSTNARNVHQQLQDPDNLAIFNSTPTRRNSSSSQVGGQSGSRPPSQQLAGSNTHDRNLLQSSNSPQQRNRTGNHIFRQQRM